VSFTEKRTQNIEWLLGLIERNPGQKILFWVQRFSILSGLRSCTVTEYLKVLHTCNKIRYEGGKVYVV